MENRHQDNWIFLSYPLNNTTPVYGGRESLQTRFENNIESGDSCNTQRWSFSNHLGTHMDFPRHFLKNGNTVCDYPPAFWIFYYPLLIDISPVDPASIITIQNFNSKHFSDEKCDLLLIKTGFYRQREKDIYWKSNPAFSPEFANELRNNFPMLRVVGFDSISLSSFVHRDLGREAHLSFLDHDRPVLPLEDMDLSAINEKTRIKRVIISPLRVEHADGAPCMVLAEVHQ